MVQLNVINMIKLKLTDKEAHLVYFMIVEKLQEVKRDTPVEIVDELQNIEIKLNTLILKQ